MSHQADPCADLRGQLRSASQGLFHLQQQLDQLQQVPTDPSYPDDTLTQQENDLQTQIDEQQAYIASLVTQLNECEHPAQPNQSDELSPS